MCYMRSWSTYIPIQITEWVSRQAKEHDLNFQSHFKSYLKQEFKLHTLPEHQNSPLVFIWFVLCFITFLCSRLKHNQEGILCVTFCKKWKLFSRLYFYLKWYCDVWGMLPNRILFSILSSFFKLAFITTDTTKLYITFFHNKIYNVT